MARKAQTVDDYIAARQAPVAAILGDLRALVRRELPSAEERMKHGAPMYFAPDGEALVYLYGGKAHAHLGFVGGERLDDPEGLLKGRGDSRHVIVRPDAVPAETAMVALLAQCAGTRRQA